MNNTSTKMAQWAWTQRSRAVAHKYAERDRQNPKGIANTLLDLPLKWRMRKSYGGGTMGRNSMRNVHFAHPVLHAGNFEKCMQAASPWGRTYLPRVCGDLETGNWHNGPRLNKQINYYNHELGVGPHTPHGFVGRIRT